MLVVVPSRVLLRVMRVMVGVESRYDILCVLVRKQRQHMVYKYFQLGATSKRRETAPSQ